MWNDAGRAGKTAADFGEYQNFLDVPAGATWQQFYQDSQILEGKASGPLPVPESGVNSYADIPSLNAISNHEYPKFDLNIPDQYRADVWQQSFANSEKTGKLASLNMLWLPDDHTAGIGGGTPYPVAEVADNDLALGRIVDTISHSQFWKSTAIFVLEDDPQNGVDHVDGHRSVLWVISPYARHGAINDTYYTQINVVKTIEMILGARPMNQEDEAALPMYNAFTAKPDFTPLHLPAQPGIAHLRAVRRGVRHHGAGRGRGEDIHRQAGGAVAREVRLREMDDLEQGAALAHRAERGRGHRQPGAAQPAGLVRLDRLDQAIPGRHQDPLARPGTRPQPPGQLHRLTIANHRIERDGADHGGPRRRRLAGIAGARRAATRSDDTKGQLAVRPGQAGGRAHRGDVVGK